jgi:hypothetical protein
MTDKRLFRLVILRTFFVNNQVIFLFQPYVGGVVGYSNFGTASDTFYYGCNVGVGGFPAVQIGTTPFAALSTSSITVGGTSTIMQSDTSALTGATLLGSDFAVSYPTYQSDESSVANISGTTVTGIEAGPANITGTMTITENGLAGGTGFTGATQTISVPVSMPLTVTQATLTISVTSDVNSVTVGNPVTLTATLSNVDNQTGTVTFLNGTDILDTGDIELVDGEYIAEYTYTQTTVNDLSITAEYSGDANNTSATSTATAVTVSPVVYDITVTAGTGGTITTDNSGNYAAGDIVSIAATASQNYRFNGWTVTGGGTFDNSASDSTTLTMPAGAATVTANFTNTNGN